jgi:uncharacterized protein (DUF302 family)
MAYYFSKIVDMDFGAAVAAAKDALKRHNFSVVAEIDMKKNLEKALNLHFRRYLILGTCHPAMTYRALEAEDKIGTMLPCNVVLQEREDGTIEVAAVDPVSSMQAIHHVVVDQIARDIRSELQRVIDDIPTSARVSA